MKIKHEHIRIAMNAWARPDGEKVPAAEITRAYFELSMTFPELYDNSHPEALARNTQKIFRWVEKDTPDAVKKIQALLPAIEKAMPPLLVARMR
ncbi:toxin YdaT family protein, partial [Escherichia albertii]